MRLQYVAKILGLFLIIYSASMLPPILVAKLYMEKNEIIFLLPCIVLLIAGLVLWYPFRNKTFLPRNKDGFLIVVCFWFTFCLVSSIPFILSSSLSVTWIDALFEAASGVTTTGATVFTELDNLPRSILYYRQQLQFVGGLGIIILTAAILPTLKVGGMQILQTDMSGSTAHAKLSSRIFQTAKTLWMIYIVLTIFCAVAYWAAGMDVLEAIGTSFGTVSTGGYAMHDQSLGYYQSQSIELIAIVFMLFGASSFLLHYAVIKNASLQYYFKNLELIVFLAIIVCATILCTIFLLNTGALQDLQTAFVESLFNVVSSSTTTGFSPRSSYASWPLFLPILILLMAAMGGCAASTAGGIKMVRIVLLYKQGEREVNRLIHPYAHYLIKFGHIPLSNRVISAIWGFLATYMATFGILLLLLLATGLDFITAYSSLVGCISNSGKGLGMVAENFQSINIAAKVILSFAMVIGRLEIFTVLVLLSASYWRN